MSSDSDSSDSSSPASSYLRKGAFPGHRDTLARIRFRRRPAPAIPPSTFLNLLQYLSFDDYRSLRLVSRIWLRSLPPPKCPASFLVPREILQQIYEHSSPADYDAARHTCKSWLLASLDTALQDSMLRAAGCRLGADFDMQGREGSKYQHCYYGLDSRFSEEWLLSKRLATECRLSPEWQGSGLKSEDCTSSQRMKVIGCIDYTALICSSQESEAQAKVFQALESTVIQSITVSSCSKFVLFIEGISIYVYQLLHQIPWLRPFARINCPRKVLYVSMDTDSGRYAVAALLAGRLGMCCDLSQHPTTPGSIFHEDYTLQPEQGVPQQDADHPGPKDTLRAQSSPQRASNFLGWGARCAWLNDTNEVDESPPQSATCFPVEVGPQTYYHNVCSVDDPPLSVAICPQRRCVAFGCQMGIELHWVDASSGDGLDRYTTISTMLFTRRQPVETLTPGVRYRWFPLAAPSNHLYFLPQRRGVDSSNKLRLISSAAVPQSTPNHDVDSNLPLTDSDHYRAVPLSDGRHMLFIEPTSLHLCLGSDAPVGAPTKLLRKVICLPPPSTRVGHAPSCYTAGSELQWGVRIAAAFGRKIMMYSIPSDVFERICQIRRDAGGSMAQSDLAQDAVLHGAAVQVSGVQVGTVSTPGDVVDVAVSCAHGGIQIWAWTSGQAMVWGMGGEELTRSVVLEDGAVST